MAEYDQQFLDRMVGMEYEEMIAYLHSLPEAERRAMTEAINRAAGQRVVAAYHDWLAGGPTD